MLNCRLQIKTARRFRAENVTTASIFQACKHSFDCDRTIDSWQRYSLPDIQALAAEWQAATIIAGIWVAFFRECQQ